MSDYVGLEPGGHVLLEPGSGLLAELQPIPPGTIGNRTVLLNSRTTINGTNVSANVEAVTVDLTSSLYDITTIGQGGHIWSVGPRSDAITLTYWQNYDIIDDLLASLRSSSGFTVTVDTLKGSAYTGTCVIADYIPAQGKVGDGLLAQVNLPAVGELAVTVSQYGWGQGPWGQTPWGGG